MKTTTTELLDELTRLAGYKAWDRTAKRCSGKYRGTVDYGILLDGKIYLFITNGMKHFETAVKNFIHDIKNIRENRERYKQILQVQLDKDNRVALSENLQTAEIVDVNIETENKQYFLWCYVLLRVAGREFKFTETKLHYNLKGNNLDLLQKGFERSLFTAGGIEKPDFIFGNVRHSSTSDLYKIC